MDRKRIAILGSTGSIGRQTLDVVARHQDRLQVVAIAGRRPLPLAEQAARFDVPLVGIAGDVSDQRPDLFSSSTRVLYGDEALVEIAVSPEVDILIVATVGRAGLAATLAGAQAGKKVAIANKEPLVMAGRIITSRAARHGATLLPIDSEHSALWQCLLGEEPESVETLFLTASGGALRDRDPGTLDSITPEDALRHPTWSMGPKVTVDSATLMNKGLEVMEARWLFDISLDRIRVIMHPTSTVHALVMFRDGVLKAQLGSPDMRVPIQFALSYPERWALDGPAYDVASGGSLHFAEPELGRYRCLDLALQAARRGGTFPAALCGADEVAVELFLDRRIPFTAIPRIVEGVLDRHVSGSEESLDDILAADGEARLQAVGESLSFLL